MKKERRECFSEYFHAIEKYSDACCEGIKLQKEAMKVGKTQAPKVAVECSMPTLEQHAITKKWQKKWVNIMEELTRYEIDYTHNHKHVV